MVPSNKIHFGMRAAAAGDASSARLLRLPGRLIGEVLEQRPIMLL
jgi:hypothetical protein